MAAGSILVRSVAQPWPERAFVWRTVALAERAAALTASLVSTPVVLAAAGVIGIRSHRSPLVAHRRVGLHGRPLWVYKLRTMWAGSPNAEAWRWVEYIDDQAGPASKRAGDPRVVSRFARFCRRFSLDELPQLWQVAAGQMALVGPRPLTGGELLAHYGGSAIEVLQLKPGLSGLWQVMGRNRLSYAQRRRLDLFYVRRRSLRLYLRIVGRTLPSVLSGRDSW